MDRTGHSSSVMINRYRQQSRSHAEVNLGTLVALDEAIPELRERRDQQSPSPPKAVAGAVEKPGVGSKVGSSGSDQIAQQSVARPKSVQCLWCRSPDLNRDTQWAADFESAASANSATSACSKAV